MTNKSVIPAFLFVRDKQLTGKAQKLADAEATLGYFPQDFFPAQGNLRNLLY